MLATLVEPYLVPVAPVVAGMVGLGRALHPLRGEQAMPVDLTMVDQQVTEARPIASGRVGKSAADEYTAGIGLHRRCLQRHRCGDLMREEIHLRLRRSADALVYQAVEQVGSA